MFEKKECLTLTTLYYIEKSMFVIVGKSSIVQNSDFETFIDISELSIQAVFFIFFGFCQFSYINSSFDTYLYIHVFFTL